MYNNNYDQQGQGGGYGHPQAQAHAGGNGGVVKSAADRQPRADSISAQIRTGQSFNDLRSGLDSKIANLQGKFASRLTPDRCRRATAAGSWRAAGAAAAAAPGPAPRSRSGPSRSARSCWTAAQTAAAAAHWGPPCSSSSAGAATRSRFSGRRDRPCHGHRLPWCRPSGAAPGRCSSSAGWGGTRTCPAGWSYWWRSKISMLYSDSQMHMK